MWRSEQLVVERARETRATRQSSIECSSEPVALRACMLLLLCEGLECEACMERPIRDRAALLLAQQPAPCACHMPLTRICVCVPRSWAGCVGRCTHSPAPSRRKDGAVCTQRQHGSE